MANRCAPACRPSWAPPGPAAAAAAGSKTRRACRPSWAPPGPAAAAAAGSRTRRACRPSWAPQAAAGSRRSAAAAAAAGSRRTAAAAAAACSSPRRASCGTACRRRRSSRCPCRSSRCPCRSSCCRPCRGTAPRARRCQQRRAPEHRCLLCKHLQRPSVAHSNPQCRTTRLDTTGSCLQRRPHTSLCGGTGWLSSGYKAQATSRRPPDRQACRLFTAVDQAHAQSAEQEGGPHVREEAGVCSARHARHTAVRAGHHLMTRKPSQPPRIHTTTVPRHNVARLHVCCDAGQAIGWPNRLLPATCIKP